MECATTREVVLGFPMGISSLWTPDKPKNTRSERYDPWDVTNVWITNDASSTIFPKVVKLVVQDNYWRVIRDH